MSLGGDVPEPQPREAVVTAGHTGAGAADLKTHPTDVSPEEFVSGLSPQRRVDDGRALLELFARVTDAPAVMWGPSMIGYGEAHYRYATGREGDTFQVGFSPRKSAVSLYGLQGHPRSEELLGRLGKHRTAVSCVYVNSTFHCHRVGTDVETTPVCGTASTAHLLPPSIASIRPCS